MQKKKIVATIEARMSSSRLPGKMALEIYPGLSALAAVIERLTVSKRIDEIVVATTLNPEDDALVNIATKCKTKVFRGSEDDVLGRVVGAGKASDAYALVLVTGDCSCISSRIIDDGIDYFLAHEHDLISNCLEETYPIGIDLQVVLLSALERSHGMACQLPYREDTNNFEHTNFFIRTHPDIFDIYHYSSPKKYNRPDIVLALDTAADLEILRKIYSKLYPKNKSFDIEEILGLLEKEPDILKPLKGLNIDRVGIK